MERSFMTRKKKNDYIYLNIHYTTCDFCIKNKKFKISLYILSWYSASDSGRSLVNICTFILGGVGGGKEVSLNAVPVANAITHRSPIEICVCSENIAFAPCNERHKSQTSTTNRFI